MNSEQIWSGHSRGELPMRSDWLRGRIHIEERKNSPPHPDLEPLRASTPSDSYWSSNCEMHNFNRSYINSKVMQHWLPSIILDASFYFFRLMTWIMTFLQPRPVPLFRVCSVRSISTLRSCSLLQWRPWRRPSVWPVISAPHLPVCRKQKDGPALHDNGHISANYQTPRGPP